MDAFPWAGLWLVVVVLLAFIIGRELVCWYFKLNAIHLQLAQIEKHLRRIAATAPSPTPPPPTAEKPKDWLGWLKDATPGFHWKDPEP